MYAALCQDILYRIVAYNLWQSDFKSKPSEIICAILDFIVWIYVIFLCGVSDAWTSHRTSILKIGLFYPIFCGLYMLIESLFYPKLLKFHITVAHNIAFKISLVDELRSMIMYVLCTFSSQFSKNVSYTTCRHVSHHF